MIRTHLTVDGGEQWLSWAQGRVRALRALDLPFLTKRYEMGDGSTVVVRITPWDNYIELRGTAGGYECIPHSNALPQGDRSDQFGNPRPPEAFITIKNGTPKVTEHKSYEAGYNDWQGTAGGKLKIITYNALMQRYRLGGAGGQALPGIYVDGEKIPTKFSVAGVGLEDCGVAGAGMVTGDATFYVIATTANKDAQDRLFICYTEPGSTDWKTSLVISTPLVNYRFSDPVYFSPDGKKFNTLLRFLGSTSGPTRKVSGTLSAQKVGTTYRVHTTFEVSDELYAVTKEEITPPTWTGDNLYEATIREYTVPVAFDYDAASKEIPVTFDVATRIVSLQVLPGITAPGTYTGSSDYENTVRATLRFGAKAMKTVVWRNETISSSVTESYYIPEGQFSPEPVPGSMTSTYSSEKVYGLGQFLAADARYEAFIYAYVESRPATSDGNISTCNRKAALEFVSKGERREKNWVLPQGQAITQNFGYASSPHQSLSSFFAAANYASRGGKSAVFSASPDAVLQTPDEDLRVQQSMTWITGDNDKPWDLFTLGGQAGFAINPITIF